MTITSFPIVGCLLKKKNLVLLQERKQQPFKHYLTLPVGKIRYAENIFHAFKREVREETGLTILNFKLRGLIELVNLDEKQHTLVILLESTKFKGKLKSSREGKLYWIGKSDLKKYKIMPDIKLLFKEFLTNSFIYANVHLKRKNNTFNIVLFKKLRQ